MIQFVGKKNLNFDAAVAGPSDGSVVSGDGNAVSQPPDRDRSFINSFLLDKEAEGFPGK